jgi:hypothetical protein
LDYQSSLGTYDVIAGVNYIFRGKLEFDAGIQAPVIQRNNNSYFPDDYADPRSEKFAPTNQFRRKADALLRAGYYIRINRSITIKPNLLAVYHLGEDTYEDRDGIRKFIEGTRGLTLNGAITASKRLGDHRRLELIVASPFVVRRVRADGLTREAVVNVQYSFAF